MYRNSLKLYLIKFGFVLLVLIGLYGCGAGGGSLSGNANVNTQNGNYTIIKSISFNDNSTYYPWYRG